MATKTSPVTKRDLGSAFESLLDAHTPKKTTTKWSAEGIVGRAWQALVRPGENSLRRKIGRAHV